MKRISYYLTFIILISGGCASFERSAQSGYSRQSTPGSLPEPSSNRGVLARMERELEGRREREQYFVNKPYITNDADRIEFLRLETYRDRQKWLEARGINNGVREHSPTAKYLIDAGDIALGMTFQAVKEAWGEPEQVEAAGQAMYGNQRWFYSEQVSSTEGYRTQRRIVYFDAGRVVGWNSRLDHE